jgi:hypothetical protein
VVGRRALEKQAASVYTLIRFETEILVIEENQKGLERLNEEWLDRAMMRTRHQRIILEVRLQLCVLACNLGNFLRRLGLPKAIKDWSLRSLQVKLIKMGGRIVRHARQIVFQLAEVAVSREMFAAILERISRLSLAPG